MAERRHPLLRLLHQIRSHKRQVLLASLFSVLNKIFDLAPPALIGAALDVVVKREDSLLARLGVPDVYDQLVVLSVLTVAVWGLESVTEYLLKWLWRNLAQTVQHELRLDAYAHIQDLDMAWFADRSRGGLMSILNDDINQLERFLDGGADSLLQVATTAIVVGSAFFGVSWSVAIWAIAPVPVILWGSFTFQARIAPRYAAVREEVSHLNGVLANNLSGIATIKAFTTEAHEARRVQEASERYRQANRTAIALSLGVLPPDPDGHRGRASRPPCCTAAGWRWRGPSRWAPTRCWCS